MSKLGFDKVIKEMQVLNKEFLQKAIVEARKEFKRNFDGEIDSEAGVKWSMVLRAYPPPILDVTGELRAQAISGGTLSYYPNKAVLVIDPVDGKGRGYASYHQDGTDNMPKRTFITQSSLLTDRQREILSEVYFKAF